MTVFLLGLKRMNDYLHGMIRPLIHFVGFRNDRYWNAVRVWGLPDMIHEAWDCYAANDTAPGDTIIFAEGDAGQKPRSFTVEAERNRQARLRG